jgi:hypothetical protein
MDPPNETNLTAHSWLSVITFLVVIAIVIRPIRIPLPIPVYVKDPEITATDADADTDAATDRSTREVPSILSETNQVRIPCEGDGICCNNHLDVNAPEDINPHTKSCSNMQTANEQGNMDDSLPAKTNTIITTTNILNNDNNKDDNLESGSQKRKKTFPYDITLNIATAPVLGVLFLLATRSINGQSVRDGIMGEPSSGVEPYAVMVLFFSLVR